jgi:pimeloyl-ACP methyl ester carboxylesterase
VIFAHGYVSPTDPIGFYHLAIADLPLPLLAQAFGYAFATTSYRTNGLAILEGAEDVRELIAALPQALGRSPGRVLLTGVSEGALVATLVAERPPRVIDGALAMCGPIGDFRAQIDYVGDFRVLFDYFFPGVIPGTATSVPSGVMDQWETTYAPAALVAMASSPDKLVELIRTSGSVFDVTDPLPTALQTALTLLWYSVFATNDTRARLLGNPYDNQNRVYAGSNDDARLNAQVARFTADPAALSALASYQVSGRSQVPLVSLHTTGDSVVPIAQAVVYYLKSLGAPGSPFTPLVVPHYGHCGFTVEEAVGAFILLVIRTTPSSGSQSDAAPSTRRR